MGDAYGALPVAGPYAVTAGIPSADDQYLLPFGSNQLLFRERHAGKDTVLLRQHVQCRVDAFQFASGDGEVACLWGSGTDAIGVKTFGELPHIHIAVHFEVDAFFFHHPDTAVDDGLVQLEVGDAVTQQAAGRLILVEDGHCVPFSVELVGGGQSGRPGTDDGYFPSVAFNVPGLDVTFAEGCLGNGRFILADGDGRVHAQFQHATLFAEGGADAAGELRKIVGFVQYLVGFFPFAFVNGILKFGLLVAQRTSPVAEGNAAVHAA